MTTFEPPHITFSWCPTTPILATGSFQDKTSQLELFQLSTGTSGTVQKSIGKVHSPARLSSLAWGAQQTKPWGVLAAGTTTGGLELWDPYIIAEPDSNHQNAFLSQQTTTHTQSIFYMEFNVHQPNLLVTAGSDNEVFIWDLAHNPEIPYTPGAHTISMDQQLTKVAWNCQVPYILATCFSNGHTSILDLRSKKKVMEVSARNALSSVAWHPDKATQLVTASTDDAHPVVTLWDLRRAQTPEQTMQAHSKGVLDVSWCRQDSELLVSSGKDGKILSWEPCTGRHTDIAESDGASIQIDFCPRNPNWLASASNTGEVNVWSIQHDHMTLDGSSLIHEEQTSYSKQPPKWLRRSTSATFGFGGKLVRFGHRLNSAREQRGKNNTSTTVNITTVQDADIVQRSANLEYAKIDHQMLLKLVDQKCKQNNNLGDWAILKILFMDNAREQLIQHFGMNKKDIFQASGASPTAIHSSLSSVSSPPASFSLSPTSIVPSTSSPPSPSPAFTNKDNSSDNAMERTTTLSGIFRSVDKHPTTEVDDFFSSATASPVTQPIPATTLTTKAAAGTIKRDRHIVSALAIGDFDTAVTLCLKENRIADALLLAISGGPDLFARTRRQYLESHTNVYMQLLDHLVRQDLMTFVQNSLVDDWQLVLAVLCTYASSDEFASLCEALGHRLETAARNLSSLDDDHKFDPHSLKQHAAVCYIAAGKLERILPIWITQLDESKQGDKSMPLQELMEKVAVFLSAIDFDDPFLEDQPQDNNKKRQQRHPMKEKAVFVADRWMDMLYSKYCAYADLLASHGQLDTATKYLGLVPNDYYDQHTLMAIIRDRIHRATSHHGMIPLHKEPPFPFDSRDVILYQSPIIINTTEKHDVVHQKKQQNRQQQTIHPQPVPFNHSQYYQPQQKQQRHQPQHQQDDRANIHDSQSEALFMTAREIPFLDPIHELSPQQQQESHFFDYMHTTTTDQTTADTIEPSSVYVDMPSLTIASPTYVQQSDMENTDYFDKPKERLQNQFSMQTDFPGVPPGPPTMQQQQQQQRGWDIKEQQTFIQSPPYPQPQRYFNMAPPAQQQQQQQKQGIKPIQQQADDPDAIVPVTSVFGTSPIVPYANTHHHHHQHHNPQQQHQQQQYYQRGEKSPYRTSPHEQPYRQTQGKRRYSKEDRSHIKPEHEPIYHILSQATPQSRHRMELAQKKYWEDTDKRLGYLFEQLNNHEVSDSVAQSLLDLVQAFVDGRYERAQTIQMNLVTTKYDECSSWLLAVKRVIDHGKQNA